MEEENIYEDLDNFILEQQVEQVKENNKELQQTIAKLEETTKKFTEEIGELKKINQNLERNISTLFKTAKNEIERKDMKITELQRELDYLKFRRGGIKKGPKCDENNVVLQKEVEKSKCVIEEKNRIIQSLTKELESVKKEFSSQDKRLKRNASHFEDNDIRSRLGKKRKVEEKSDYQRGKSRRPRSRSKSREMRFDSRLKSRFDKKRTIRRNRSGSFEKRRSSIIEKHRNKYENSKYSKSGSRSPEPHKKYNNPFSEKHCRITGNVQLQEKINKIDSQSRSTSTDRKKYHKYNEKAEVLTDSLDKNIRCEKKVIHINHLVKEDSGMSSSNSHTSELLLKCDEIKANVLEHSKVEDLEEGEIDCTLEDINSDEDNIYFKEKVVSSNKANIEKTPKEKTSKLDKNYIKKSNELYEQSKKVVEIKKEKPVEKVNKNTETTINVEKPPDMRPELVTKETVINIENKVNDDLKSSQDVLELMVQSNYLDDLDIDEEIIKMRLLDDDKRKKRKEDKERISKLRTAISECKQNIELLEHNFSSDEESETEDEFNRTGSCVEENVVNTKQNNLVLKISKGSIVISNVGPKIDHFKDPSQNTDDDQLDANNTEYQVEVDKVGEQIKADSLDKKLVDTNKKERPKHIQQPEKVLDTNQLDAIHKKHEAIDEIKQQIQNDILDKNLIDVDKKEKQSHIKKSENILDVKEKQEHIVKPEKVLDKNVIDANKKQSSKTKIQKSNDMTKKKLDADKKESSKDVGNKNVKEIHSKSSKDNDVKKNKSCLEDDNRKKRKDTNEKCNRLVPRSKYEKVEKSNTNTKIEEDNKTQCNRKTESIENNGGKVTEHELFEAINNIVDNVKVDENKLVQNFANITNLDSAVSDDGQNKKATANEELESKLKELFDVENDKKENVSTQINDKETTMNVTKSKDNETERKAPLKARRRRAFICIT